MLLIDFVYEFEDEKVTLKNCDGKGLIDWNTIEKLIYGILNLSDKE